MIVVFVQCQHSSVQLVLKKWMELKRSVTFQNNFSWWISFYWRWLTNCTSSLLQVDSFSHPTNPAGLDWKSFIMFLHPFPNQTWTTLHVEVFEQIISIWLYLFICLGLMFLFRILNKICNSCLGTRSRGLKTSLEKKWWWAFGYKTMLATSIL